MALFGLSQLNLELSSYCDKNTLCFMCGHQDPKIFPFLKFGHMNFDLLCCVVDQLPKGIIVSLHRDGDPLVYPKLHEALVKLRNFIVSIVTHGEALGKRAHEIIGCATTVTVSVISKDPDRELQLAAIKQFLVAKGDQPPQLQLKFVGEITNEQEYIDLGVPIINRVLHVKPGNYRYIKRDPIVPEVRVCLDFLSHPTVDWQGRLFVCNRLDAEDKGLLGDLKEHSLDDLWNSPKRLEWLEAHKRGRRDQASPLCKDCLFYGVPTAP